MTTNNAVNVNLSGQTGTGSFVGSTSPTLVTPALGTPSGIVLTNASGSPTLTQITFSPTTGGIVGTTTNDNAAAGKVGEFLSSVILSSGAVSVSASNTATNLTSLSLTAGDWDVWGNVFFTQNAVAFSTFLCWISTTSASAPDTAFINGANPGVVAGISQTGLSAPQIRISIASPTTVYISGLAIYASGSTTIVGGLYARRVR